MTIGNARGCGFHNEVGCITFSLLVESGFGEQGTEMNTQMFLTRAIAQVNMFQQERLYCIHENLSVLTDCKCVKEVFYRGKSFYFMNCIIRLQSSLKLLKSDKLLMLHAISRRLFYVTPALHDHIQAWLLKHRMTDYRFVVNGLFIRTVKSLKMALSTMRYEASVSNVPRFVPFMPCMSMLVRVSRWMVMTILHVDALERNILQPVFFRSTLKKLCPPEYWQVLQQGLCYMVGVRERVLDQEEWIFHIHTSYEKDITRECDPNCFNCTRSQPLSLFHIAQLNVIKMLFIKMCLGPS